MIHPGEALLNDGFVVLGTGAHAPVGPIDPGIQEAVRYTGRNTMCALAAKPFTKLLVAGTRTPGKPFIYSNDLGVTWNDGNTVVPNVQPPAHIFWVPIWNKFIAIMAEGGAKSVSYSADGITWTPYAAPGGVMRKATGFTFNLTGSAGVIALEGVGQNMLVSDNNGLNWGGFFSGIPGGCSLAWNAVANRYLAFVPGTNNMYQSTTGFVWNSHSNGPDVVQGPWAAYSVRFGSRLLLFGSTEEALYSDDGGASWDAATGLSENTSPDNRMVAINGDTLYVAFRSDYNEGAISYDAGETWSDCAHQSGKPLGIAVLLQ